MVKRILLFGVVPLALTGAGCATLSHGNAGQTAVATPAPNAPDTAADSPFSTKADVSEFLAQAQQARKSGDLIKAIKVLSQLVLVAPDDPKVMGEYGKALAADGRSDDAIAFLDRAIQLQAGDWTLYSAQGVAYDQQGKYQSAQLSYARALELKPGEAVVINNDALSHIEAGDYAGAEDLLNQVSRDSPDYARISSSVALLQKFKPAAPAAASGPAMVQAIAAADNPPDDAVALPSGAVPHQESVVAPPAMLASSQDSAAAPAPAIPEKQEFVPVPPSEPVVAVDLPVAKAKQPKPDPAAAAPFRTALDRLKADPTVVMQRLPGSDRPAVLIADAQSAKTTRPAAPVIDHSTSIAADVVPAPGFYVQAGSYLSDARARQAAIGLESLGVKIMQATVNGREVFRLRIGPFADMADAKKSLAEAKALGRSDLIIVREQAVRLGQSH